MGRTVKFALASVLVVSAVSALAWGVMSVGSLPVAGAASTGSGRPDMVDLLNTMLKLDVASASSLTVKKMPANSDSDGNGIPDNLFDARYTPAVGEVWVGDSENGAARRVAVANLAPVAGGSDYVEVAVQRGLTVVAPSLDALRAWAANQPTERAGHLAVAESALLVVTASSSLAAMVDGSDGQYSSAAAEAWAGESLALAPAGCAAESTAIPYIGIAVVYTYNGGQDVAELSELPANRPVTVRMDGADLSDGLPAVWSYPVDVDMNAATGPMLSGRVGAGWASLPVESMRADAETGAVEACLTATGLLGVSFANDLDSAKAATVTLTMSQVEGLGHVYPPKGAYEVTLNSEISLTATAGNGWRFDHWEGAVKDTKLAETSVVMSTNKTIKAYFVEKPVVTQYTLSVTIDGSGDTDPVNGEEHKYDENEDIEILAKPSPGWRFGHWEGSLSGTENPARLRMDANKAVTAVFEHAEVVIKSVTPNSSWLFGGVISEIRGSNFGADSTVKIGDQQAVVTSRKTDAATGDTLLTVAVPPLDRSGAEAEYPVDVEVRNPTGTSALAEDDVDVVPAAFTYIRYDVASDTPTTAFMFSASAQEFNTFVHLIGTQTAKLKLPVVPQTGYATFFGLVRAAKEPKDLHLELVDSTLDPSGATDGKIPLIWFFDLHVYGSTGAVPTQTTPGTPIYTELTKTWVYNRGQGSPAVLEIPVNDTALLPTDVESGLRAFSIQYDYNYAATTAALQVPVLPNPVEVTYQSTVLKDEMTFSSVPSAMGLQSYEKFAVRLYQLGAVSLERGALPMPKKVLDGIKVDTVATGSLSGGTAVRLLSSEGGLAWIDKVVFGDSTNGTNAVLSTATGTSEFAFDILSPPYDRAGSASVSIYLKSNPNAPIKTVNNAFTYSPKATETWATPVLVAVGAVALAVAGIALGKLVLTKGPCFIATAAYGTPMAAQIDALRLLRDEYLLNNPLGTAFVDLYYHISPSIADVIAGNPFLAMVTRIALIPVVFYARALVTMPVTTLFATFMMVAYMAVRRTAKRARKARG